MGRNPHAFLCSPQGSFPSPVFPPVAQICPLSRSAVTAHWSTMRAATKGQVTPPAPPGPVRPSSLTLRKLGAPGKPLLKGSGHCSKARWNGREEEGGGGNWVDMRWGLTAWRSRGPLLASPAVLGSSPSPPPPGSLPYLLNQSSHPSFQPHHISS